MVRSLIFDTETTGKWEFKKPIESPAQPNVVQLACKLVEGSQCVFALSTLVRGAGPIPAEAQAVHGISEEQAETLGLAPKTALTLFKMMAETADELVAHNSDFDRKVMVRAFMLANIVPWRPAIPILCTMKSATPVLALPGRGGKAKWPTLKEAFFHLVNTDGFEGAHDALADVDACWRVLTALRARGHPILTYSAQV